jgi:SSS family solute:Na+ symporter
MAARQLMPAPVGVLLLGAACAVVISTGMNYLLSPSTNIMRDVYQRFLNKEAKQSTMVALQKVFVVILGVIALFLAIKMRSVLDMAIFAYTIYGVSLTPALIAALAWKRVTKIGGLASIISGTLACLILRILVEVLPERLAPEGDPFGIPLIYPALFISITALIVGSLLTKKQDPEMIKKFFPDKSKA